MQTNIPRLGQSHSVLRTPYSRWDSPSQIMFENYATQGEVADLLGTQYAMERLQCPGLST